jgi:Rad3-related DNA helicase
MESCKQVITYIESEYKDVPPILALPILSKKSMKTNTTLCKVCTDIQNFYSEELKNGAHKQQLEYGAYTIEKLNKISGKEYGLCAFHLVRKSIPNIAVCTHKVVIRPKLRRYYLSSMPAKCVVVMDEGHNIGNVKK